jgi:methionine-rich copper-binding protein CopC
MAMAARLFRWCRAILVIAILGGTRVSGTAQAHASYVRSEPGAGAVVSTPPAQVEIWVAQDLFRRQGENWIRVTGPDGAEVQAGEATIDDDDRRHLTVALQPSLTPGEYTVTFRTLSAEDGDDDEDSFTFTLDPNAEVTSTPMSVATPTVPPAPTSTVVAAAPSPTQAGPSGPACGAALAPAVGLVVAGAVSRARRRRSA